MEYLYKLEIELDDEKIIADDKYDIDSIYDTIRSWFKEEGIPEISKDNSVLIFASNKDDDKEFSRFGLIETELMDAEWFRPYVKKMFWYNNEYGKNYREDIIAEDKKYRQEDKL